MSNKITFEKTFTKEQVDLLKNIFKFKIAQINGKWYAYEDSGAILILPAQTKKYPYPNKNEDLSGGFHGYLVKRTIKILEELLNDNLKEVYAGPTATPMIFVGDNFEIHLAPQKGNKIKKEINTDKFKIHLTATSEEE